MRIRGFKAFNSDMTNRYGQKFEEGETYQIFGPLKFGNAGNGFHFCKRMEDTLRYFDGMNEEIKLASVVSDLDVVEFYDDYYGYYDIYASSMITIEHIYERREIIDKFLNESEYSVERFLKGFRLSDVEVELFRERFAFSRKIMNTIAYFQEGDLDVYSRAHNSSSSGDKVKVKKRNEV